MDASGHTIARAIITLAVTSFATLVLASAMNIFVDLRSFGPILTVIGFFQIIGIYCHVRKMQRLSFALLSMSMVLFATVPILISTYIAIGANFPLADEFLIRTDRVIGFDWVGFVQAVDNYSVISDALGEAYSSFALQLLIIPIALAAIGLGARSVLFAVSYLLLCLIASMVSVLFPSIGAYAAYGLQADELSSINAHFGFFFLEQFHGVRSASDFVITAENAAGIITFPSVHAAVACLCIWAVWPLRYVFMPVLALNVLMIVSAITHGGHYLIDLPAGALTCAVGIFSAQRLLNVRAHRFRRLVVPSPAAASD